MSAPSQSLRTRTPETSAPQASIATYTPARCAVPSRLEGRRELLVALDAALRARLGGRALLDATPAARALVTDELERAERLTRNTKSLREVSSELKTLRRSLYPYQREGVERFLRSGRLLLADDMGLGKTTQAIAACHALYEAEKVKRGLVIVPASLKPQWPKSTMLSTSPSKH